MRGLYASVMIETTKKIKYKREITAYTQKISDAEKEKKDYTEELDAIRSKHNDFSKEVDDLRAYIKEKRKILRTIPSDPMTIDQAGKKLSELETESQAAR